MYYNININIPNVTFWRSNLAIILAFEFVINFKKLQLIQLATQICSTSVFHAKDGPKVAARSLEVSIDGTFESGRGLFAKGHFGDLGSKTKKEFGQPSALGDDVKNVIDDVAECFFLACCEGSHPSRS